MSSNPSDYQLKFTGPEYDFTLGSVRALRGFKLVTKEVPRRVGTTSSQLWFTTPNDYFQSLKADYVVDKIDELHGLFDTAWLPGEQRAVCKRVGYASTLDQALTSVRAAFGTTEIYAEHDLGSAIYGDTVYSSIYSSGGAIRPSYDGYEQLKVRVEDPAAHSWLSDRRGITPSQVIQRRSNNTYVYQDPCSTDESRLDGCVCGFYAYHGGMGVRMMHDLMENQIVGVTEHYGRTLIGERGIRSTRAKVVALAVSDIWAERRVYTRSRISASSTVSAVNNFVLDFNAERGQARTDVEYRLRELFPDAAVYGGEYAIDEMLDQYPIFNVKDLGDE